MKQVFFDGKGKLLIKDVPAPAVPVNGALVRVSYELQGAAQHHPQRTWQTVPD